MIFSAKGKDFAPETANGERDVIALDAIPMDWAKQELFARCVGLL